jgi:hypothetical protein
MGDLKRQMEIATEQNHGVGRVCEFGEYYEPIPGYVAIDLTVYLTADAIQKYRAMEEFENDTNANGQVH